MMDLESQLREMEGKRNIAYQCSEGKWTIGVGHTGPEVCEGLVWTDELVNQVFKEDLGQAVFEVFSRWPWAARLSAPRQAVLINMVFQMGPTGVSKFKRALASMEDERWPQAAGEMLDSKWAKQTPNRARRLARQMETGEWQ